MIVPTFKSLRSTRRLRTNTSSVRIMHVESDCMMPNERTAEEIRIVGRIRWFGRET